MKDLNDDLQETLSGYGVSVKDGSAATPEDIGFALAMVDIIARGPAPVRREGTQFGDSQGPIPEAADNNKLSRILDMLDNAKSAGVDVKAVWAAVPPKWRVEYNYGNWKYEM